MTDRFTAIDAPSVAPATESVESQIDFGQRVSGRVLEDVDDFQPCRRGVAVTCIIRKLRQLVEAEVALLA